MSWKKLDIESMSLSVTTGYEKTQNVVNLQN